MPAGLHELRDCGRDRRFFRQNGALPDDAQRARGRPRHVAHHVLHALALVRLLPCPGLKQQDAKGVHVRLARGGVAAQHLGRHPQRVHPLLRHTGAKEVAQPEVTHLGGELSVQLDVGGAQHAVQQWRVAGMHVAHPRGDVAADAQLDARVQRHYPVGQHVTQAAALHVLHHQEATAVLAGGETQQGDEVRVAQREQLAHLRGRRGLPRLLGRHPPRAALAR
mmetsp:Transcript_22444/g.57495  ORF Transcript_22444/g.57495 Transcript_22444/m.57495 type:complete len:222 (-) Transcript_22444:480-1145(-)